MSDLIWNQYGKSRIRLVPVAASALIAFALTSIWPYDLRIVAVTPVIALVTQFVSPWNRQAAAYARYVRATAKAKAKAA